jgi:hypothetical protein
MAAANDSRATDNAGPALSPEEAELHASQIRPSWELLGDLANDLLLRGDLIPPGAKPAAEADPDDIPVDVDLPPQGAPDTVIDGQRTVAVGAASDRKAEPAANGTAAAHAPEVASAAAPAVPRPTVEAKVEVPRPKATLSGGAAAPAAVPRPKPPLAGEAAPVVAAVEPSPPKATMIGGTDAAPMPVEGAPIIAVQAPPEGARPDATLRLPESEEGPAADPLLGATVVLPVPSPVSGQPEAQAVVQTLPIVEAQPAVLAQPAFQAQPLPAAAPARAENQRGPSSYRPGPSLQRPGVAHAGPDSEDLRIPVTGGKGLFLKIGAAVVGVVGLALGARAVLGGKAPTPPVPSVAPTAVAQAAPPGPPEPAIPLPPPDPGAGATAAATAPPATAAATPPATAPTAATAAATAPTIAAAIPPHPPATAAVQTPPVKATAAPKNPPVVNTAPKQPPPVTTGKKPGGGAIIRETPF